MDTHDLVADTRDTFKELEDKTLDIIDALQTGKMTSIAARLAIRLDFGAARADLDDWESRLAGEVIHVQPRLAFRVVKTLPSVIA